MNWWRVARWTALIVGAWWLITDPHGFAAFITSGLNAIKGVGSSLSTFFTSVGA